METPKFLLGLIPSPKPRFNTKEESILKALGLFQFATKVEWGGRVNTIKVEEALIHLKLDGQTTTINGKICELIPQSF